MKFLFLAFVCLAFFFSASEAVQGARFLLFTRRNPTVAEELVLNDVASISRSRFNPSNPVRFLVHGWQQGLTHEFNTLITDAYLRQADVNVIMFDWRIVANDANLLRVRNSISEVGQFGANFLDFLTINSFLRYENLYVVGHGIGAHLAGMIGKVTRLGRIEIIFGLDPSERYFEVSNPTTRLDTTDAFYVEVMHTNWGGLGIGSAIGHADFKPQGGQNQPGCENDDACSHERSFRYFAESINSNQFGAFRCQRFESVICLGEPRAFMGDPSNGKANLRGFFRLLVNREPPFAQG